MKREICIPWSLERVHLSPKIRSIQPHQPSSLSFKGRHRPNQTSTIANSAIYPMSTLSTNLVEAFDKYCRRRIILDKYCRRINKSCRRSKMKTLMTQISRSTNARPPSRSMTRLISASNHHWSLSNTRSRLKPMLKSWISHGVKKLKWQRPQMPAILHRSSPKGQNLNQIILQLPNYSARGKHRRSLWMIETSYQFRKSMLRNRISSFKFQSPRWIVMSGLKNKDEWTKSSGWTSWRETLKTSIG